MKKSRIGKGFTLIELLVVIAIIGILTSIVMASLASSRAKSRDAKRISDLAQIQLALEQYFERCHSYPRSIQLTNTASYCEANNEIKLGNYISVLPTDPQASATNLYSRYNYSYESNQLDYILHARLETGNSAMKDSIPLGSISGTWYSDYAYPSPGMGGGGAGNQLRWTASGGYETQTDKQKCTSGVGTFDYCVGPK